jgi:hypothetical protein
LKLLLLLPYFNENCSYFRNCNTVPYCGCVTKSVKVFSVVSWGLAYKAKLIVGLKNWFVNSQKEEDGREGRRNEKE